MKLLTLEEKGDDINYIFNVLQNIKYVPLSHKRHWISTFSRFEFAMSSGVEQQKIGAYFKELDNLITLHQREP
jgi:type I restriction enzyme S subunit